MYVLEESDGKQYFSDFSQFRFGLAMEPILSESAFLVYAQRGRTISQITIIN